MNFTWTKIGVFAVAALSSSAAFAAEISFNFRVNSSAVRLYPCDAGLLDSTNDSFMQAKVGTYDPNNPTGTFPSTITTSIANTTLSNFRTFVYPAGFTNGSGIGAKFETIIKNTTTTADGELTFNLASPRFGAQYFVDFCYLGTQLDTSALNKSTNYNYLITDLVTGLDLTAAHYIDNSSLRVRGKLVCEPVPSTATSGSVWDGTGLYDSFAYDDVDPVDSGFFGLTGGPGSVAMGYVGDLATLAGGSTSVFSKSGPLEINLSSQVKKCVLRYIFEETALAPRKWDLLSASFVINLQVSPKKN